MKEVLTEGNYKIGDTVTREGRIVACDVHLSIGKTQYLLTAASRAYIRYAEKYNRRLPEDDPGKMNLEVYVVKRVDDERQLLAALSRLPFAKLEPYLVEQKKHGKI